MSGQVPGLLLYPACSPLLLLRLFLPSAAETLMGRCRVQHAAVQLPQHGSVKDRQCTLHKEGISILTPWLACLGFKAWAPLPSF